MFGNAHLHEHWIEDFAVRWSKGIIFFLYGLSITSLENYFGDRNRCKRLKEMKFTSLLQITETSLSSGIFYVLKFFLKKES